MNTEPTLAVAALRQTATELLRLYDGAQLEEPFEPLDECALTAWERIATGTASERDLEVIRMRRVG